ncbi:MAG: hypothetical protein WCH32_01845 [Pseudomonadota bacterium]
MLFSSNFAGRKASLVLVTAVVVTLAGCSGGDESAPLIRTSIKVQSITQQGNCEDVNVKVVPVSILPDAPKMSNSKEFVTPVKLTKGADGVSCAGEAATIPMAPGKWKFTASLPSEIASCERDVALTGSAVAFKDAENTCS